MKYAKRFSLGFLLILTYRNLFAHVQKSIAGPKLPNNPDFSIENNPRVEIIIIMYML